MKIGNNVVIEGTATIENLPISNSSLSAIVQTEGNLYKRELGTISTASKESYIPGLSVAFPSIFNLNTESLDYNNRSLVVSLKNQLQGTAFLAPTAMNGTPAFRRIVKTDLTDATVLFSDDPRIANWDTSYGWGDHRNKYPLIALNGDNGGNSIQVKDSRSVNDEPSPTYRRGVFFDFKTNAAIELTKSGVGTFSGVMTVVPYSDSSGWNHVTYRTAHNATGLNIQTWFNGWQPWRTIWDSTNLPTGTLAQLNAGTVESDKIWSPKTLNDWGKNLFWNRDFIQAKAGGTSQNANTMFGTTGGYIASYNNAAWLTNGAFSGYGGIVDFSTYTENLSMQLHYVNNHGAGNDKGGRLAFRTKAGADYNLWNELWHSGNMEDYHIYGIGSIAVPIAIDSPDIQVGRLFRNSSAAHLGSILSMPYDGSATTSRTNLFKVHDGQAWISSTRVGIGVIPTWKKLLTENDVNLNNYVLKSGDLMSGSLQTKNSLGVWASNTANNREVYLEMKRGTTDVEYGTTAWSDMRMIFNNDFYIERKLNNVAANLIHISSTGLITSALHGNSANWKQAFDWGPHSGQYLRIGDNRSFVSKSVGADLDLQRDSLIYATGANRPSNINSTVLTLSGLADYGFQLAGRNNNVWFRGLEAGLYKDWNSFWHSGNLSNPASQAHLQNYYTKTESLDLFVGLNTTQTIGGTKTFSLNPVIPTATLNSHAINKGQIESWVNSQGFSTQTLTAGANIQISTNNVISATNTTYSAGTLALLNTGTDTSNRVWKTKDIADYVISKIAQGADSIWEHTSGGGIRVTNYDSLATRDGSIAFGRGSGATKLNAIALGTSSNSDGNDGIVVGPLSVNLGTYGTVVGPYSVNTAMEGVVTGPFLQNNQRGCTVTGRYNNPILSTTTNTITDSSPLFIIGNGKSASIRSNAYFMRSDGKGEFVNVQSYKTQPSSFNDLDIPNWKFIQENISGGGNGSEDWVSNYGSQISVFEEQKANEQLGSSPYGGTGEILADQKFSNVDKPTLVYLGNDGVWRKWNNAANAEEGNLTNRAVLGIALSDMKSVLLRGYYLGSMSIELETLVTDIKNGNMFHSINKGSLMAGSSTSFTERVFGYSINESVAYFNPWMF